MRALYTIGYTKKTLREFITRLRAHGVDCVVDIRLNNTSQLAGFSKRDDLEFLLKDGFGIGYVHLPDLAPTEELLTEYRSNKNWDSYQAWYESLVEERGMVAQFLRMAEEHNWQRPCLLCAEDVADHCHRRVLAEAIADEAEDLEVVHL